MSVLTRTPRLPLPKVLKAMLDVIPAHELVTQILLSEDPTKDTGTVIIATVSSVNLNRYTFSVQEYQEKVMLPAEIAEMTRNFADEEPPPPRAA